jgi:hypothetical protein
MIGGNIIALFQVKDKGKKNEIGEREHQWVDVASSKGWLDLNGGDSKHTSFNAKVQESTHIFLCDYQSFKGLSGEWVWNPFNFISGEISTAKLDAKVDVTSENARMLIDNSIYQIMLIDDPMGMHQHLEIFLKYVGGQNGG